MSRICKICCKVRTAEQYESNFSGPITVLALEHIWYILWSSCNWNPRRVSLFDVYIQMMQTAASRQITQSTAYIDAI